jgi:LmbE family N-acetylglucosaminyl deacetylase
MNKILLISPHLDDAILSAGRLMADRTDNVVVTVFAGNPEDAENVHTPYDKTCGFGDAAGAMYARREENDLATALLNADAVNFDYVDEQYGEPADMEQVLEALQRVVDGRDYDYILGPLGLGHPDHVKVSDVVRRLKTDKPIYLWEDLPLRVVEPELVPKRLAEIGLSFDDKVNLPAGDISRKVRALSCYTSQIGTGILDPFLLYVPERFYKI